MIDLVDKKILFLGIGGISMHQLALVCKNMGVVVFGYDKQNNKYTQKCKDCGIPVTNKFRKDFLKVDICVVTPAIKNNKYISLLQNTQCVIYDRIEFLNIMSRSFKCVIAVAGTHGKSTTASLIYEMLRAGNKRVSCHIGADVENARFNLNDDYLVVEACEYNKSFLKLNPDITVVTNVEAEHMDSYKSIFQLRACFKRFLQNSSVEFVFKDKSTKFLQHCKSIKFINKEYFPSAILKGEHNMKNLSLSSAVAFHLGVEQKDINKVISTFKGIPRRYEFKGYVNNTRIFIDYAHHPTEIKSFANTFLEEENKTLIVFQPHTYSRTKLLLKDFVSVLSKIKNLVIFEEYSAREKPFQGMSAKELYFQVKKKNQNVIYWNKKIKIESFIQNFDAVAFVGAGDIDLVAEKLVKTYEKKRLTNS